MKTAVLVLPFTIVSYVIWKYSRCPLKTPKNCKESKPSKVASQVFSRGEWNFLGLVAASQLSDLTRPLPSSSRYSLTTGSILYFVLFSLPLFKSSLQWEPRGVRKMAKVWYRYRSRTASKGFLFLEHAVSLEKQSNEGGTVYATFTNCTQLF
jgi:hypothetical protein